MKRQIQSRGWQPRSSLRMQTPRMPSAALSGATLSEILISLMVMGIGVTSLALLISTSVLRSIQASQLTNATIHRLNAEQLIGQFSRLVHDPDNNRQLAEHEAQNNAGGRDNPVDSVNQGRFIVDPVGWNNPSLRSVRGFFGSNNTIVRYPGGMFPTWRPGSEYQIGDVVVARANRSRTVVFQATNSTSPHYSDTTEPTWPATAGNTVNDGDVTWTSVAHLDSYPSDAGYLGDSWLAAARGIAESPSTTDFDAPSGIDLTDARNAINAGLTVRAVLYTANGRQSFVRDSQTNLLNISGQKVTWTGALPTGTTISRFRIEISDPRYSWLLTVRKTPGGTLGHGQANVDVVVFHKRSFNPNDEQVFTTSLSKGSNSCTIQGVTAARPFRKTGGYLFDAQHAHWYRIVKLTERVDTNGNPVCDVELSRPAVVTTNAVIGMPGIVEVYPIDPVEFDDNNAP